MSEEQQIEILKILSARFEKNMSRHQEIVWAKVETRLIATPEKIWSLNEMERTGGEPDVVGTDKQTGEFLFFDCSLESPNGRKSLCYDNEALESRKSFKPKDSAVNMALNMGIELLTEEQYRELHKLGKFDAKSQNWLKTPEEIRKLGGAIFADYRFNHIFIYHNGAESYYAIRGFRGCLRV